MTETSDLTAGVGRVNIDPPLPADTQGYIRRARAPRGHGEPLEIRALAIGKSTSPVVILTADLLGIDQYFADLIRAQVADTAGVAAGAVLLNSSHSHLAMWARKEYKLPGEFAEPTPAERAYIDKLPHDFATAALLAVTSMRPARVAGAVGKAPLVAVNRRERTADGRTVLGWNQEGFIDDDVPVIRVDSVDGDPIATVVAFGCHPVCLGPEHEKTSADYVGALRRTVENTRGGMCLFLQGAGGNIIPLEAMDPDEGPEQAMGRRLGMEASHAADSVDAIVYDIEQTQYGLLTPVSLYRRSVATEQQTQAVAYRSAVIDLPINDLPDRADLEQEMADLRAELEKAEADGAGREVLNPISYHLGWAEKVMALLRKGERPSVVQGEIWACRIGPVAIIGTPGEVFAEIGHQVRSKSPFDVTLFAGYSQGVLGYIATAAECAYGGYEPTVAHRGYRQPAGFAPEAERALIDACVELLESVA